MSVIGAWAVVGAGSVVTRDVPDYGLVYGNPARLHGFACPCGSKLKMEQTEGETVTARCTECGQGMQIPLREWEQAG